MRKTLQSAALSLTMLAPSLANAAPCDKFDASQPIILTSPEFGPLPVFVGALKGEFDSVAKRICFSISANKGLGFTTKFSKGCFNVEKDENPIVVHIKFPNGIDFPYEQLTPDFAKKTYEATINHCLSYGAKPT